MPHVFLQSLDVISRHDAVHREGMPQIVHPVMLQTGRCQNVLEFLPDRRLGIVAAIRMIEHQAGEFLDYHIKCNTAPKKERHCVRFVLE